MIKRGFIQYIGCYSNGGLVSLDDVDCDMMFTVQTIDYYGSNWNSESRFTKILYSEIDKIRQSNIKNMGKALYLYAYIKKYITVQNDKDYAVNVSFPSENTLSKKCGCSISTVKKHIQSLCSIKMLYMKNYGSYLRMLKGKEIVVNSNNVYALEEKYLNSDGEEALRDYLKFNMGYIDGFYPFCDNLPDNNKKRESDPDDDNWGEPNSMDNSEGKDYSLENIVDMPTMGEVVTNNSGVPKQDAKTEVNSNMESCNNYKTLKDNEVNTAIINPVKTITIKKKTRNKEIPINIKIQEYADDLYEQHGYGNEYEKSIFIADLAEKFPGLDDYEKYYDSAKKLHDLSV